MVEKVLENRFAMIAICVGIAIGTVGAIATGFVLTYDFITYVGT